MNAHAHSRDPFAHEATLARAVGSAWRKTLYMVGSNAFGRKKPYPPGNRSGKAEVISTTSNFRMSAAPINSYPGTHAGAPHCSATTTVEAKKILNFFRFLEKSNYDTLIFPKTHKTTCTNATRREKIKRQRAKAPLPSESLLD